jgi:voltage-gated potassium channel Kch
MRVLLVGPDDRGLERAFDDLESEVVRLTDVATAETLAEAGVEDADILVLTAPSDATAVPIALERNPDLRTVIYSPDGIPEFVRGQLDLALDPRALPAETVAEELVGQPAD